MVAVVILNYNNADDTIECIKSVEKYNTYKIKFIIIDNGSTDDSVKRLQEYISEREDNVIYQFYKSGDKLKAPAPYISLIESPVNSGYANGNNIALHFIETDPEVSKILILNNDVLFIEDILPVLCGFLDNHPDAAIVSPALLKRNGIELDYNCARKNCSTAELLAIYAFQIVPLWRIIGSMTEKRWMIKKNPDLLNKEYFEIELPSGSCMLINKDDFRQIGYFDSRTFLYYEENILFKKISRMSKRNYIVPSHRCIHLGGSTTKKTRFTEFQRIQINSSAYIYARYYSGMSRISLAALFVLYKLCVLRIRIIHFIKGFIRR